MQTPEIQRVIQIIVEELAAAGYAAVPTWCGCHSVLYECCPDRVRGILDAGATRIGLHASGGSAGDVATMIDHTLLKPDATRQEIETLCRVASALGVPASELVPQLSRPPQGGSPRASRASTAQG